MSLNAVFIQGRLTSDCDLRYTRDEKPVASFTLAVDRPGKDAGTDFVSCVAWEKTARFVDEYFRKGDMCLVTGRLTSRKWEDKDGNKRTSWEVVVSKVDFCGGKSDKREGSEFNPAGAPVDVGYSDMEEPDGRLPF